MAFNTKFKDILTALETQLKSDFPDYSIYIGRQSDGAPALIDVSINAGRAQTNGNDGIWKFPIVLQIQEHGGKTNEDTAGTAGGILEAVQAFFASTNTEPLTDSTYWGRVTTYSPLVTKKKGFYNRWFIHALVYVFEAEYGTLGTVTLTRGVNSVDLSIAVDVELSYSLPEVEYPVTTNNRPEGIDRRSRYLDYNIKAILLGASARTNAALLLTMLDEQLGNMADNNWTVTLSGALETMFGTTRQMGPAPGNAFKIRAVDGDQYVVRITGLNLREIEANPEGP